jgi:hypothetical protein
MYSAYTGWSTAPIAYGLLQSIKLREKRVLTPQRIGG